MNTASSTAPLVKLAIISEGIYSWPLYVAQERRLFERAGIDVHTTLTGSSVQQLEQLNAGAFDIGFQQADHVVRSVERGGELFIFMAQAHAPELSLVAGPGIVSFDDLGAGISLSMARAPATRCCCASCSPTRVWTRATTHSARSAARASVMMRCAAARRARAC